ncbi:hypothetical protein BH09MYX1_BH09MYX1_38580 [soil metagenome]
MKLGTAAALLILAHLGCASGHSNAARPEGVVADAAAAAAFGPSADAGPPIDDSTLAAPCAATAFNPAFCAPELGELDDDAIVLWFETRGVKVDSFTYEACHEVLLGHEAEHALVCTSTLPIAFDKTLGMAGPIERLRDVGVVTVRNKQLFELVRLPLAFGDLGLSELLFSADYSVDASAVTFDLEAPAEQCLHARAALVPYWDDEVKKLRDNEGIPKGFKSVLIHATQVERASDITRINLICGAAGHYVVGQGGHLVKAPRR